MKNNGFKAIMGSNELLNQSNFSVAHNGQAACWLETFLTDQEAHFQKTVILNSLVNMISFSFSFFNDAFYASGLQMSETSPHVEMISLMFSDADYTSETSSLIRKYKADRYL